MTAKRRALVIFGSGATALGGEHAKDKSIQWMRACEVGPKAGTSREERYKLYEGKIEPADIDRMVEGTLASFFRFGFYDRDQTDPDALGFGGWHDLSLLPAFPRGSYRATGLGPGTPSERYVKITKRSLRVRKAPGPSLVGFPPRRCQGRN